jgi:hypothetical protein
MESKYYFMSLTPTLHQQKPSRLCYPSRPGGWFLVSDITTNIACKPRNAIFGMFFSSKHDFNFHLKAANLFCSNPSCAYIFAMTYKEFCERTKVAQNKAMAKGEGIRPVPFWTANVV